ncbi:MAG TPA: GNAT family N-acetyltransferase [Opitutus sp.]|nr:GNAT family N-acetyltransferase [Opitutus sp.]
MAANETNPDSPAAKAAPANLEFVALRDHGVAETADLLTRAFAGYFVRIVFTADLLAQMARNDSVDFDASRVVRCGGTAIGAALIARRGDACRLAAMGVVSEARRTGAGRALVARVVAEAAERGERSMRLEVIEQNEPAVRVYAQAGFATLRRLVGFLGAGNGDPAAAASVETIGIAEAADAMTRHAPAEWPWQLSGETLANVAPPGAAHRCGAAWIVLTDPATSPVTIRGLAAPGGTADAVRLLRGVMGKYPGRDWRAAPVWPEEHAGAFSAVGLKRMELSQWQMIRRLA